MSNPAPGAVRVALGLAELHVQPRVEQAAEDRAHDRHGVEVGDASGQTRRGRCGSRSGQLPGDGRPGRSVPSARGVSVTDSRPPHGAGPRRPDPEQVAGHGHHVLAAQVPADDERRPRGVERPARRHGGARAVVEGLDGVAQPRRRSVVGRRRRVDRADERLVGPPARIGLGLEQVVEPLVAQPLDLARAGTSAAAGPRRAARGPGRRRADGTSRPMLVASQPASAWREAPSRSEASVSSIAS